MSQEFLVGYEMYGIFFAADHDHRGHQTNRLQPDSNALVEDVLRLLRHEAAKHRIPIYVRTDRDLPAVQVNAVQLGQVTLNLVCNAFDACADCPPERQKVALMTRALAA